MWLAGEHTHSTLNGLVNGAYETGEKAAREVKQHIDTLVSIEFAQESYPYHTHVFQKMLEVD